MKDVPIEVALAKYNTVLQASAEHTSDANDKPRYTQHLAAAAPMFAALRSNAPLANLKSRVAEERRSCGWAFLAGDQWRAAEAAFDAFAKLVEAS